MEIIKLRMKTEEGETEVKKLNLIENHGVEGDKKAKGGDKQLCLADEAALSEYRKDGVGLCVKRFMPNISTAGIDYSTLKPGTQLKVGDALIEISSSRKKCFPECELIKNGRTCQIIRNSAFAKIIKSGSVEI